MITTTITTVKTYTIDELPNTCKECKYCKTRCEGHGIYCSYCLIDEKVNEGCLYGINTSIRSKDCPFDK